MLGADKVANNGAELTKPQFNVLLVDDEEYARRAVQRLLKVTTWEHTCRVFEASEGRAAIKLLRDTRMHCILLDMQMPGGEGDLWLPRIAEIQPEAAIIMVTGVRDEERAVEAMKNGASDYLVKGSISPWSLQRAITQAVARVNMQREIAEQRDKLLAAERQRVVIESLGAACHHLGQPMVVLNYCLDELAKTDAKPEFRELLGKGMEAKEKINQILSRMQRITAYQNEPYVPGADSDSEAHVDTILTL